MMEPTTKKSNLDRLLQLIEYDDNATRIAAAQQIGEIHRNQCNNGEYFHISSLLKKVSEFLTHKEWGTRTGGAEVLFQLSMNLPAFHPPTTGHLLSLTDFDLNKVLEQEVLLKAAVKEYNSLPIGKEQMRENLKKKLDLDFVPHAEDILGTLNEEPTPKRRRLTKTDSKEPVDSANTKKMSARELNRAKRKAKQLAKKEVATPAEPAPVPKKEMDIREESEIVRELKEGKTAWTFEGMLEWLKYNLFDASWEIRHGAALGLRAFFKAQAKQDRKENQFNFEEDTNRRWLEDCAIRLLCIQALDRFTDYVDDQKAVAPIRETAAQALAALYNLLSTNALQKLLDYCFFLQKVSEWQVRHGGFLCMKYMIVIRAELMETNIYQILNAIDEGLHSSDDDVRAIAAQTLASKTEDAIRLSLSNNDRSQLEILWNRILEQLWALLISPDELSPATSSIVHLLAALYTHGNFREISAREVSLHELLPRLFPLLRHSVHSVRESALVTLKKMIERLQDFHNVSPDIIWDTLYELFHTMIVDDEEMIHKALDAWNLIVGHAKEVLHPSFLPRVHSMITMGSTPIGMHLKTEVQKYPEHVTVMRAHSLLVTATALGNLKKWMPGLQYEDIVKSSSSASSIMYAAYILEAYAKSNELSTSMISNDTIKTLETALRARDHEGDHPVYYQEVQPLYDSLRSHCEVLAKNVEVTGLYNSRELIAKLNEPLSTSKVFEVVKTLQELEEGSQSMTASVLQVLNTARSLESSQKHWNRLKRSAVACSLVYLPFSSSENVSEALIDTFDDGVYIELQMHAAEALADLLGKMPTVYSVVNLFKQLCAKITDLFKPIAQRGATHALQQMVVKCGADVFNALPTLWDSVTLPLRNVESTPTEQRNSMLLLQCIVPYLHPSLHERMLPILYKLGELDVPLVCETAVVIVKHITVPSMDFLISTLVPSLKYADSPSRIRITSIINSVVDGLGMDILPYCVLLVVPLLGYVNDRDIEVRKNAVQTFAKLVKLLPLEKSAPSHEGMSLNLVARRQEDRRFVEQLLDISKLENYNIPVKINAELRSYQQEGVNWLAFLNNYNLHGCLCDDMGLGKTLQTICMLAGDHFTKMKKTKGNIISLVVCPLSVVGHWHHEILRFCQQDVLRPLVYIGTPQKRSRIRESFHDYNVVITSYETVRNDIEYLDKLQFNYCVLDEGHVIRNPKSKVTQAIKQLQSSHRLILSGTPIQNNVLELWSLFDFLMPGFLGSETWFQETYANPILRSKVIVGISDNKRPKSKKRLVSEQRELEGHEQEPGVAALESLHRQVLPFILRRLKKDVLKDLPPKIIQDYYCEMSSLQTLLYERFIESQKKIEREVKELTPKEPTKAKHIFQALLYLRKLCTHPLLVLKDQESEIMKEENLHDLVHAPKFLALKELLHSCGIGQNQEVEPTEKHRVLVFAQLKSTLDMVENDLLKTHMPSVTYLRLDPSLTAMARQQLAFKFNSDPTVDLLLLTTSTGGLGLNLTGADVVILLEHDWNPMKDLQAMDRAHRIGATKVVNVYRLITRGTLEEKIMSLQQFKLNIANTVISEDNVSMATMDTSSLLEMFSSPPPQETSQEIDKSKSKPKGKLQQVLDSLGELWDKEQYEEYDLQSFLSTLGV